MRKGKFDLRIANSNPDCVDHITISTNCTETDFFQCQHMLYTNWIVHGRKERS